GRKEPVYEIVVEPRANVDWPLAQRIVNLRATDFSSSVFTGLWKAFEESLQVGYGVADLVQLSGYYQYRPKIESTMKFLVRHNNTDWRVVQNVVQSAGVGKQLSVHTLGFVWGIAASDVFSSLLFLRNIGYEVRNQNTNSQIPHGEYLIPYAFPT